jgi:hypothetical protein
MGNPNTSISSHQCTVTPPADGKVATTVCIPGPYKIEIDLRMTIMAGEAVERLKAEWKVKYKAVVTEQRWDAAKENAKNNGKSEQEAEKIANAEVKKPQVTREITQQVEIAAKAAPKPTQEAISKRAAFGDSAYNLPYVLVRMVDDGVSKDIWKVLYSPRENEKATKTSVIGMTGTTFYFSGPGKYRVYAKEPTMLQPNQGENFSIPHHSSAPADDSLKKPVMPVFSFEVEEASQTEFKITYGILDNLFFKWDTGRYSPNRSTISSKNKKITLEPYVITPALWGDAMPAYGTDYLDKIKDIPDNIRRALDQIYTEKLKPYRDELGRDGLKLTWSSNSGADMSIEFDNQATDGGHTYAYSFTSNEKMSRSESLRRTHPSVFIWWLKAMEEIKATGARITGAWRPHTGSTRHRYSVALDVADLTKAKGAYPPDPMPHGNVVIHFNTTTQKNSAGHIVPNFKAGPLAAPIGITEPSDKTSMEYFQWQLSKDFFTHVIKEKREKKLAWLGGPWVVYLTKTGELSSHQYDGSYQNEPVFNTDNHHKDHVHLSIGTDQKG